MPALARLRAADCTGFAGSRASTNVLIFFRIAAAVTLGVAASAMIGLFSAASLAEAPQIQQDVCARPEPGSAVPEPQEVRSRDGVLAIDLTIHNQKLPDGAVRYCYRTSDGKPSPTLRLKPGDELVIHLKNDVVDVAAATPAIDPVIDPVLARAIANAPICTARKKCRSLQQRRDDAGVDQPALSWTHHTAGLPSGRRAEDLDPA